MGTVKKHSKLIFLIILVFLAGCLALAFRPYIETVDNQPSKPILEKYITEPAMAVFSFITRRYETSSTVFKNKAFYTATSSQIDEVVSNLEQTDPAIANSLKTISEEPEGIWFGSEDVNPGDKVNVIIQDSVLKKQIPVFVIYYASRVSCPEYATDKDSYDQQYLSWISNFASGLDSSPAVIILEPDAMAITDCLYNQPAGDNLIAKAVDILKQDSQDHVYIDAGHAGWTSLSEMSDRLLRAGIKNADGFSLNVSNFTSTSDNIQYGNALSALVGNKHYIIDTSRNGNGATADSQWCNPSGRALGPNPTPTTSQPLADAFLWIKDPGESDGACNGGPDEGVFWTNYALDLIKNRNLQNN